MSTLILIAALLVIAFEFQNLISWWRGRVLDVTEVESRDFTIIVPLFGDPRYFEARESLQRYRKNVLVAMEVTPSVMEAFADELEADGWGVSRIRAANPNPALLVAEALRVVTTTYALRLDADTLVDDDIPAAVAALAADGGDIASTKVDVSNAVGVPAKMQRLEYRIAMLTRHYRPWLTSGACFIARTNALRAIFARHTKWTPGEDIETGRVAVALRMKIRHVDVTVRTAVPETWWALLRQRRLWWAGNFRHAVINLDRNAFQMPVMSLYWMLLIWLSFIFEPWHAVHVGDPVSTLPLLYVSYLVVTVVPNLKVASPWMVLFPFLAFVQSALMPPVGAISYALLARRKRTLGRYRFPLVASSAAGGRDPRRTCGNYPNA
ncbi:MAG TPA: glycosyltransferase family 2 protein [Thermoleophilaceae bacterium]